MSNKKFNDRLRQLVMLVVIFSSVLAFVGYYLQHDGGSVPVNHDTTEVLPNENQDDDVPAADDLLIYDDDLSAFSDLAELAPHGCVFVVKEPDGTLPEELTDLNSIGAPSDVCGLLLYNLANSYSLGYMPYKL